MPECERCQASFKKLTSHHVIPRRIWPAELRPTLMSEAHNIASLCESCHRQTEIDQWIPIDWEVSPRIWVAVRGTGFAKDLREFLAWAKQRRKENGL